MNKNIKVIKPAAAHDKYTVCIKKQMTSCNQLTIKWRNSFS